METATIKVNGMRCGHCKAAVEKALGGVEGVSSVAVDLKEKSVEVQFNSSATNLDAIKEIIEDEGYEVVG
jgi:copper chaperone